jgi:hypothetical protein
VRQRSTDERIELAVGHGALVGGQWSLLGFPSGDGSKAVLDAQACSCGIVEPGRQALAGRLSGRGGRIRYVRIQRD